MALLVWLAAPALAQPMSYYHAFVEPRLTTQQYESFAQEYLPQQRFIADQIFDEYNRAMQRLLREADEHAQEAGLDALREANRGNRDATFQQLSQWSTGVYEAYSSAWPQADALFNQFVSDIALAFDNNQRAKSAQRALRRIAYLHPFHQAAEERPTYAGDSLDLLMVIEDAAAPGGELHQLLSDSEGDQEIRRALLEAMATYEKELDAILVDTYEAARTARVKRLAAYLQRDAEQRAAEQENIVKRWERLYALNNQTAEQTGGLLAQAAGDWARQLWQQRYQQETFPWLYETEPADQLYRFVQDRNLTGEAAAEFERIYQSFRSQREKLRTEAVELHLEARRSLRTVIGTQGARIDSSNPDHVQTQALMNRNASQRVQLHTQAVRDMKALLNADDRDAFEMHLENLANPNRAPRRE